MENNVFTTLNEKQSLKQISPKNINTGGKIFLELLLLKVCELILFRQIKKACGILLSMWVSLTFLEEILINTVFEK